jgi:carotenoid cleavage dioxygenase-like enzyme
LDVISQSVSYWSPPAAIYPSAPVFVPLPNAGDSVDDEDAGVLLVSAVDTLNKRGE